jgi:hypothetical protein
MCSEQLRLPCCRKLRQAKNLRFQPQQPDPQQQYRRVSLLPL